MRSENRKKKRNPKDSATLCRIRNNLDVEALFLYRETRCKGFVTPYTCMIRSITLTVCLNYDTQKWKTYRNQTEKFKK